MTQAIDVDTMEAGREMDALVAERVMGDIFTPSPYSTDIAAAWRVVDALIPKWDVQIDMSRAQNSFARLVGRGNVVWYAYGNERGASGAPLAICRAALKAVSE